MIRINLGLAKQLTIFYLSLGHLIFFIGWLRPIYGVLASVLLLTSWVIYYKKTRTTSRVVIPVGQFAAILLVCLGWLLLSGVGGFGYQFDDWFKHNAVMNDLIVQQWPVKYQINNEWHYLSHYLGYYLPAPALVGNFFGWKAMNLANFAFTYAGVLLSVFWLLRFVGKYAWWLVAVFALLSGIKVIMYLYMNADQGIWDLLRNHIKIHDNTFWYNGLKELNITYKANTIALFWSPQHAIPCWLVMGLFLSDWKLDKNIEFAPFYFSLLAFWSPLVLLGCVPFFLYALIETRFRGIFTVVNLLIAPLLFGIIFSYLLSIESTELLHNFTINSSRPHLSIFQQLGIYGLFLLLEIAIWGWATYRVIRKSESDADIRLFVLTLGVLCLVPLYRYGLWNDWCVRASLPGLFVLWAFVLRAFLQVRWRSLQGIVLGVLLVLGSFDAVMSAAGSIYHYKSRQTFWPLPKQGQHGDLPAICIAFPVQQFIAKPNTFFYTYLGKTK